MKEDRNTIMYSYGKMVQRAEQRHEGKTGKTVWKL